MTALKAAVFISELIVELIVSEVILSLSTWN